MTNSERLEKEKNLEKLTTDYETLSTCEKIYRILKIFSSVSAIVYIGVGVVDLSLYRFVVGLGSLMGALAANLGTELCSRDKEDLKTKMDSLQQEIDADDREKEKQMSKQNEIHAELQSVRTDTFSDNVHDNNSISSFPDDFDSIFDENGCIPDLDAFCNSSSYSDDTPKVKTL